MSLLERVASAGRSVAGPILSRVDPLEGTNMSLWNSQIPAFWAEQGLSDAGKMFWPGNGLLADRVWIANRCMQMNAQQIVSMPLRFEAPNVANATEPQWVSNPDPIQYPNGIGSLMKGLIRDYYGWGWALLYVTSRYAGTGYPRTFTRIPAARCEPMWNNQTGRREYRIGGTVLNPLDVIQIDRDCGDDYAAHGTSAIRSYAQMAWGLLAAGNSALDVNEGGVPKAVLKVVDQNRSIDKKQAEDLQAQWAQRTQQRGGAPPVLPFELDFKTLGWSPKDMALLETQDFNALALATAFGVPAVLINMTIGGGRGSSSLTYQNPAALGEQWWRFELRPTSKGFADALTAQALPAGQWVWFDAADTLLPLYATNAAETGPFPTSEDDPQAAATATDQQSEAPATAQASPAQRSGATSLTVIGGNR